MAKEQLTYIQDDLKTAKKYINSAASRAAGAGDKSGSQRLTKISQDPEKEQKSFEQAGK